ncbi:MAG: hypothetical protein HUJ53_05900 [Holdemanella sp.]|nr:hypothetical protein [Holdemanella sp.]
MIYFTEGPLIIRTMEEGDGKLLCDEEIEQGWNLTIDKFVKRYCNFTESWCIALVAVYEGSSVGYINVY